MQRRPIRVMPGPYRARPRRCGSGYTLIELMIVLAILAAIAGVSWPALMRPWARSLSQQAAQQLTGRILEARTRAIEDSRVYRLRFRPSSGQFRIDTPQDDSRDSGDELSTRYGGSGTRSNQTPLGTDDQRADALDNSVPRTAASGGTAAGVLASDGRDVTQLRRRAPLKIAEELDHGVRFRGDRDRFQRADPADTLSRQEDSRDASLPPGPSRLTERPLDELHPEFEDPLDWSDPIWFFPDGRTSNGQWTLVSEDGYQVDVFLRGLTGTVRVGPVRIIPKDELNDDELHRDEVDADAGGSLESKSSGNEDRE